jgi:uncharacterized membrane protein
MDATTADPRRGPQRGIDPLLPGGPDGRVADVARAVDGAPEVDDAAELDDAAVAALVADAPDGPGILAVAGFTRSPTTWPAASMRVLRELTLWQWALIAMIAGYTSYFTKVTLDVHHGLGTSAYDYGLYDQGVWLMSRFDAPFVTLMGRNLIGDHTSFILVFLVPVYWVFPSAGALLFTQSLFIALGAVPVYLLGRRLLRNDALAVVLAGCYLLHPAVAWTNRENFHPDSYLAPLLGMAIYAAIERRWRLYAVFFVLSLMVKEDASLVLVPLGVWVAVKRDRRIGIISIVGSLSFMAVAMLVVMRSLIGVPTRNAWRIPFGGPSGFLKTVFTDPASVVEHYLSDNRPFYFWQMTAPFAWVFARAPSVAMISLTVLGTNMLSTFWYQYQIEYHYALVAVPALAMGTVWAVSKIVARWRALVVAVVLCTSLWSSWQWGAMPFSKELPYTWAPDHPVAVAARDIIRDVPDDAVVSAQYSMTAHLARRHEIYMFPNPFSVQLYGPDDRLAGQRLPAADRVEYVVLPATLEPDNQAVWDLVAPEFTLVDANDWWRLYRRSTMLDPDPAAAAP